MLVIRRNICFSATLHALCIAVVLAAGGNSEFRRQTVMVVSLLEEASRNREPGASTASVEKAQQERPQKILPGGAKAATAVSEMVSIRETPPTPLDARGNDMSDSVKDRELQKQKNIADEDKGIALLAVSSERPSSPPVQTPAASGIQSPHPTIASVASQGASAAQNANFRQAIRSAIQGNLIYPPLARKRRMEGTVIAEFSIAPSGLPAAIRVLRSSGYAVLDSAAKDTIVRAAPFPVVQGAVEVPITFRLKNEN